METNISTIGDFSDRVLLPHSKPAHVSSCCSIPQNIIFITFKKTVNISFHYLFLWMLYRLFIYSNSMAFYKRKSTITQVVSPFGFYFKSK